MKKVALFIFLLCAFGALKAQKKQDIYLLKNNGEQVTVRDSADFIRIIEEPDSGSTLFKWKEYYLNNKLKTIGYISDYTFYPVYEGILVSYDEQGKRKSSLTYKAGKLIGLGYYFYPTGSVKKVLDHDQNLLNYFADSSGTVQVKDGNGKFMESAMNVAGEMITEEGSYLNGVKDGIWAMKNETGAFGYHAEFDRGKLVSGKSFKAGKAYEYSETDVKPTFKGGSEALYKYISQSIRYPAEALEKHLTGKVLIGFIVEEDGKLSNFKVEQSVHPLLDQEAMRIAKGSPKWIPATEYGIPVKGKFMLPISFSTGGF